MICTCQQKKYRGNISCSMTGESPWVKVPKKIGEIPWVKVPKKSTCVGDLFVETTQKVTESHKYCSTVRLRRNDRTLGVAAMETLQSLAERVERPKKTRKDCYLQYVW